MSTLTMRYYKTTLAYFPSRFDRKVRNANKYLRTQISRRKLKQLLHLMATNFVGLAQLSVVLGETEDYCEPYQSVR